MTPARVPLPPPAPSPRRRQVLTGCLAALGAAGLLVAGAASASAHIPVEPSSTAAGSSTELTFRVPSESTTASTTSVVVHLPAAHPFTQAAPKQTPGWTATVAQAPLPTPVDVQGATLTKAPSTITWTAQDSADAVGPEQYQTFTVTVGPLPARGTTVSFPVDQLYSDGSVVHWDEPTPASGKEPENPSPSLVTTAALPGDQRPDPDDPPPTQAPGAGSGQQPGAAGGAAARPAADATARALGGVGVGLGVLAAAAAGAALLAARRSRADAPR